MNNNITSFKKIKPSNMKNVQGFITELKNQKNKKWFVSLPTTRAKKKQSNKHNTKKSNIHNFSSS